MNNGKLKGVLGICITDREKDTRRKLDYWIATDYQGDLPEGFLKLELPSFQWAVFGVKGSMPDAMINMLKKIYSEWFPSSGYSQDGTIELELYSDEDPTTPNHYAEIWIPVK